MDRFAEALLSRQGKLRPAVGGRLVRPVAGGLGILTIRIGAAAAYKASGTSAGRWTAWPLRICSSAPPGTPGRKNPQPDGEYGAAVRMYNRERRCYDMTYICSKGTTRLEVRKEGGVIALHGAGGAIQPMAVCRGDRGHLPLAERDETGGGPPGKL